MEIHGCIWSLLFPVWEYQLWFAINPSHNYCGSNHVRSVHFSGFQIQQFGLIPSGVAMVTSTPKSSPLWKRISDLNVFLWKQESTETFPSICICSIPNCLSKNTVVNSLGIRRKTSISEGTFWSSFRLKWGLKFWSFVLVSWKSSDHH